MVYVNYNKITESGKENKRKEKNEERIKRKKHK